MGCFQVAVCSHIWTQWLESSEVTFLVTILQGYIVEVLQGQVLPTTNYSEIIAAQLGTNLYVCLKSPVSCYRSSLQSSNNWHSECWLGCHCSMSKRKQCIHSSVSCGMLKLRNISCLEQWKQSTAPSPKPFDLRQLVHCPTNHLIFKEWEYPMIIMKMMTSKSCGKSCWTGRVAPAKGRRLCTYMCSKTHLSIVGKKRPIHLLELQQTRTYKDWL